MIKHDRVDQHGPSDSDRPAGDSETVSLGAKVTGKDLGGYQEGDGAPGCCLCQDLFRKKVRSRQTGDIDTHIDEIEQEEHGHRRGRDRGGFRRIVTRGLVETTGNGVEDTEAECTEHHASTTTPAIDDLCGNDGTDDPDRVEAAGEAVLLE